MSGPDTPVPDDSSQHNAHGELHTTINFNARLGLIMFAIYCVIYGVFVWLCTFRLDAMGQAYGGVNLAIWYGFGLIVAAFVMAAIYLMLCRRN